MSGKCDAVVQSGGLGRVWLDEEIDGCEFPDVRLGKRFRKLMGQLSESIGESIPVACQDWASTKAAYRFLSNERVGLDQILSGHFGSTKGRVQSGESPVLVVHDTTEFIYRRTDPSPIGVINRASTHKDEKGEPVYFTNCGISLHSSMVVTPGGLPLGLIAVKFWSREQFQGKQQRKRAYLAPIEQKESMRWIENMQHATDRLAQPERCVHIADQEGDIYEVFCAAQKAKTKFLIRTRADRMTESGEHNIAAQMAETACCGTYELTLPKEKGDRAKAVLQVRFRTLQILPPQNKQKRFSPLNLSVVEAKEQQPPAGRDAIHWTLITNLSVTCLEQAMEKLQWYTQRWKIETFHKILKTGCKAEERRLETAARLINFLSILCILSWRIFWLTMLQRTDPEAAPEAVFTPLEMRLLDELKKNKPGTETKPTLSTYLIKLARLGGYLDRNNDPPPGNMVIWRGLARLIDIQIGVSLAQKLVGN